MHVCLTLCVVCIHISPQHTGSNAHTAIVISPTSFPAGKHRGSGYTDLPGLLCVFCMCVYMFLCALFCALCVLLCVLYMYGHTLYQYIARAQHHHHIETYTDKHGTPFFPLKQDTSVGNIVAQHKTKQGMCDVMTVNPWNAVILLGHANGTVHMWTPNITTPVVKMLCHKVRCV